MSSHQPGRLILRQFPVLIYVLGFPEDNEQRANFFLNPLEIIAGVTTGLVEGPGEGRQGNEVARTETEAHRGSAESDVKERSFGYLV